MVTRQMNKCTRTVTSCTRKSASSPMQLIAEKCKKVQNFDNIDIYLSDIDIKQFIIKTPIIPIIDIIDKSLYR